MATNDDVKVVVKKDQTKVGGGGWVGWAKDDITSFCFLNPSLTHVRGCQRKQCLSEGQAQGEVHFSAQPGDHWCVLVIRLFYDD